MKIAQTSVNRPIMMSMLIIVFVLFGGLSFYNLTLNQMPDVQIPFVTVSTVYPGAGPKEIETQITKKNRRRCFDYIQNKSNGFILARRRFDCHYSI